MLMAMDCCLVTQTRHVINTLDEFKEFDLNLRKYH